MEGKIGAECEIFEWFRTHVLDSKLETGIEHQELVSKICKLASLYCLIIFTSAHYTVYSLEIFIILQMSDYGRMQMYNMKICHVHTHTHTHIYSDKY